MATYRFAQFNIDLIDPVISEVKASYQIGGETGSVSVVLTTAGARMHGVVFDGFPNTDGWGDEDVVAWATDQLQNYIVTEAQ